MPISLIEQRRRDEVARTSKAQVTCCGARSIWWQISAGPSFASALQIDGGSRLALFQIAGQMRAEKHRRFENLRKSRFDPPMPAVRLIVGGLHLDEDLRQMLREFDEMQT